MVAPQITSFTNQSREFISNPGVSERQPFLLLLSIIIVSLCDAGVRSRASCMLHRHAATELHPQPPNFFGGVTGVGTQGFMLARQLYHLSHSSNSLIIYLFIYFETGSYHVAQASFELEILLPQSPSAWLPNFFWGSTGV
jgi:hypothetical protein